MATAVSGKKSKKKLAFKLNDSSNEDSNKDITLVKNELIEILNKLPNSNSTIEDFLKNDDEDFFVNNSMISGSNNSKTNNHRKKKSSKAMRESNNRNDLIRLDDGSRWMKVKDSSNSNKENAGIVRVSTPKTFIYNNNDFIKYNKQQHHQHQHQQQQQQQQYKQQEPDQQSFNSFTSEYSDESLELADNNYQQNSMSSNYESHIYNSNNEMANGHFFLSSDSDQLQKPLKSIIKSKKKRAKLGKVQLSFDDSSSQSDEIENNSMGSNKNKPLQSILKPAKQLKISDTYEIIPDKNTNPKLVSHKAPMKEGVVPTRTIVEKRIESSMHNNKPTVTFTERRALVTKPSIAITETRHQYTKPTVTILETPKQPKSNNDFKQTFTILEAKNTANKPVAKERSSRPTVTIKESQTEQIRQTVINAESKHQQQQQQLQQLQISKPTITIMEPKSVQNRSKSMNPDLESKSNRKLAERSRTPMPLVKTPVFTTSISPTNNTSTTNQIPQYYYANQPFIENQNSQQQKNSPLNFSNIKTFDFVSPSSYVTQTKSNQQNQYLQNYGYQVYQQPKITQIHDAPSYTYIEQTTANTRQATLKPAVAQSKPAASKPKQQVVAFIEPTFKHEHNSEYSSVSTRPKTPAPKFETVKDSSESLLKSVNTSSASPVKIIKEANNVQVPKITIRKQSASQAPTLKYTQNTQTVVKQIDSKASRPIQNYYQLPAMTIKPIQPPPTTTKTSNNTNNVIIHPKAITPNVHYAYLDQANNIRLPTYNNGRDSSTNRYQYVQTPTKTIRQSNDYNTMPPFIDVTNQYQLSNQLLQQQVALQYQQQYSQPTKTMRPETADRKKPVTILPQMTGAYIVNNTKNSSSSDEKSNALVSAGSPVQNKQVKFEDEVSDKPKTPISILKKPKKQIIEEFSKIMPTRSISLGRGIAELERGRLPTKTMIKLPSRSRMPTKTTVEYSNNRTMTLRSDNLIAKSQNRSMSLSVPRAKSISPKIESPKPIQQQQLVRNTPKITEIKQEVNSLEKAFQLVPFSVPKASNEKTISKAVAIKPTQSIRPVSRANGSVSSNSYNLITIPKQQTQVAKTSEKNQPQYQLVQVPAWILKPINQSANKDQKINLIFNPNSLAATSNTKMAPPPPLRPVSYLPAFNLKAEPKSITKSTVSTFSKPTLTIATPPKQAKKTTGRILAKKAMTIKPEVYRSRAMTRSVGPQLRSLTMRPAESTKLYEPALTTAKRSFSSMPKFTRLEIPTSLTNEVNQAATISPMVLPTSVEYQAMQLKTPISEEKHSYIQQPATTAKLNSCPRQLVPVVSAVQPLIPLPIPSMMPTTKSIYIESARPLGYSLAAPVMPTPAGPAAYKMPAKLTSTANQHKPPSYYSASPYYNQQRYHQPTLYNNPPAYNFFTYQPPPPPSQYAHYFTTPSSGQAESRRVYGNYVNTYQPPVY